MKQIASITLATILLYSIAVHGVLISFLIQMTKSEVFDKLEKDALPENAVVLSFPSKAGTVSDPDFYMEEDREFSYRGKMYDVIKVEMRSDRVTYYCIQDDQETNLKTMLSGFHTPDKQAIPIDNLHHLIKSLMQDYFLASLEFRSCPVTQPDRITLATVGTIMPVVLSHFKPPEIHSSFL